MDELTRKTAKNSTYNLVAFLWPILLSFFVTPYIVKMLGVEQYGIYALVVTFVGFFGLLDLGVSPSLVKYVSEYHARRDFAFISRLFNSAVFFYLTMGAVVAALIALFARFIGPEVLKVSPANVGLTQTVLYLAAIGFLLTMVLSAFSAMPGALQRFDVTGKLNLIAATFSTVMTVAILSAGGGLLGIVVLSLSISFLAIFVYAAINQRLIPELRVRPHVDRKALRMMMSFGVYATIGTVASTILFQLDKVILGTTLGAAAVAFYVIPGTLAIKIHGVISTVTTVVFPLSSGLFAQGNLERVNNLYLRATRIVLSLIVLGVTPMYFLARPFLLYWVGPEFAEKSTLVFQLLLATYSILALTAVPFFVLYGAGRPKAATAFSIICGGLNVVLILLLIPNFGINGAAVAYLLSVLPSVFFIRYVERHTLKLSTRAFYAKTWSRLVVLAGLSAAATLALLPLVTSLKAFVLVYVLTLIVSAGIFLLLRLADPQEMEVLNGIWRKIAR